MKSLVTVILRAGEANRVVAGHPWVYESSILRKTGPIQDGDVVQVKDQSYRFLGLGLYNSKSKINIRIISQTREEINPAFFESRILAALDYRKKFLPKASSFRVVNAESDFLSGLIVDKYEDVLVIQISSLGMEQRKQMIINALEKVFKPSQVLERTDLLSRKFEGISDNPDPTPTENHKTTKNTIFLNGISFNVDFCGGHKTGLYLDQQENYQKVAELAKGKQVLDCFCFLGGFSLHAARAGADHVHGIDQSVEAVQQASQHADINGYGSVCSFESANVFDWLKIQTTPKPNEKIIPRYDLIILDPPSFTRNRASVPDAVRGYKEIHLRALKLIKKGGILATFCCSHHVNAALFEKTILDAALDARCILRRVATYSQSPDHPIIPSIPESEYLKGYAFEVLKGL